MSRTASRALVVATLIGLLVGLGVHFNGVHFNLEKRAIAADAEKSAEKQLAHIVFFTLKDSTPENREKTVELCKTYLTNHPGEVYFAVGTLNPDLKRDVNDRDFDVALHVVFKDKASQDAYQTADRHLKFIAAGKEMWKKVRVFDSDLAP